MCRDNSYRPDRMEHIAWWKFDKELLEEYEPTYHKVAGTDDWPILVIDQAGRRASLSAHWGLIPHWAKDKSIGNKMVNARRETIYEKPSYKGLVARNRCIIPSTGYFEHNHRGRARIPHFIRKKGTEIFGIAGIYTYWTDKTTGEVVTSFSMLTGRGNDLMARIHNSDPDDPRMPVVLEESMYDDWISPDTPRDRVDEIMDYSIPSDSLEAWPVHTIRGKSRLEGEAIWERAAI